jgi:hypothetical protein
MTRIGSFAGFFGSPALATGGATIADVWGNKPLFVPMAIVSPAPPLLHYGRIQLTAGPPPLRVCRVYGHSEPY